MTKDNIRKIVGPRITRRDIAEGRMQFLLPTLFLGLAGLLLLVSIFQPYWEMRLDAPQYPGGLVVISYLNHLEGDVREIDGLNHYIGMRPLAEAAQLERSMGVAAVTLIALLVVAAVYIHTRYAALLTLPAVLFPGIFLGDLYYWLHRFGTNLDPKAALSSSIEPFVPPVLGTGYVGQFATVASAGPGLILAAIASVLILIGLFFHRRAYKPLIEVRSGVSRELGRRSLFLSIVCLAAASSPSAAREISISPDSPGGLQQAIAVAQPGDVLLVRPGTYSGPLVLDRPISLRGEGWPVIDGGGVGTVIRIEAPDVTVAGFVIRGSGILLDEENSGVAVEGARAVVEDNRIEDVLFGVYVRQAPNSVVRGNRIRGLDLAVPRRGDAIRVWYSAGTRIEGNDVADSRDVVLWYSENLTVVGNRVTRGRYGLHFMYCDDAEITFNHLEDNSVGAFLMYSRRLRLHHNTIAGNHGPSGYGVGLKDMDDAWIVDNLIAGNRVGAFLDNSPREMRSISRLEGNLFAANDVGIQLLPNVRRAQFVGNTFAENREQIQLAGRGGDPAANLWQGNYWSDYRGFDADGDGFGDVPYRSERLFENLIDRHPALRLFRFSPVTRAVDFAARAFPLVRPQPKLEDPAPRMAMMIPLGTPPLRGLHPLVPLRGNGAADGVPPEAGKRLSPPPEAGKRLSPLTHAALGLAGLAVFLLTLPRLAVARLMVAPGVEADSLEADAPAPLIRVEGLTKRFGELEALRDVTFSVAPGESVALWGDNGAGKTTVLRALLGVMPFDGTVTVGGFDTLTSGKQARSLVGFVPQETAFPDLETGELLELFAGLRRTPRERIPQLLADLGLEDEVGKPVSSLSGGRKQRLALAAALLADPPLLLLDEPTANLDVRARGEFLRLLARLRRQGKTIVFSSHRPEEVRALADRVIHLDAGRVVADGPTAEALPAAHGEVTLELVIEPARRPDAVSALLAGGYPCQLHGTGLVEVRVDARRKAQPIALLATADVPVKDFFVSTETRTTHFEEKGS